MSDIFRLPDVEVRARLLIAALSLISGTAWASDVPTRAQMEDKSPGAAQFAQSDSADATALPVFVSTERLTANAHEFVRSDWPGNDQPEPPSADGASVESLIKEALGEKQLTLCSGLFAKLSGRNYQLIATMRDGRFCSDLVIIDRITKGLLVSRLGVNDIDDVSHALSTSGSVTLIATWQRWSDYEGARSCMATWPQLFACRNHKLVDVSASNRSYYADALRDKAHELAKIPTEEPANRRRDCLQMEIARLRRYLSPGDQTEASLGFAWLTDGGWDRRMKAIVLLSDVGGRRARDAVAKLAQDGNSEVALSAKLAAHMGPN